MRERDLISFVPEMCARDAATASTAPILSTSSWADSRNISSTSGETASTNLARVNEKKESNNLFITHWPTLALMYSTPQWCPHTSLIMIKILKEGATKSAFQNWMQNWLVVTITQYSHHTMLQVRIHGGLDVGMKCDLKGKKYCVWSPRNWNINYI